MCHKICGGGGPWKKICGGGGHEKKYAGGGGRGKNMQGGGPRKKLNMYGGSAKKAGGNLSGPRNSQFLLIPGNSCSDGSSGFIFETVTEVRKMLG